MNWLHYLLEANIYLGVFYLCYCLFLNRDTHYTLSRVYLIFSCVVAFIMPLTQVSILKPVMPEIEIIEPPVQVKAIPVNTPQPVVAEPINNFTFDDALIYIYLIGTLVALLVLMYRLRKLYILTRNKYSVYHGRYKMISLDDENTAFSFFNYLFIGSNVPQAETIIAHELVHIRQKHSADIIFVEVIKVLNWFNPFIYLVERSLKTVHEYIADEQTAACEQDALTYSSFLLNNAYGIQGTSIAHSFFNYNLLKKRIIMLNKNRSGKLARLKYLAVLPLCTGMLCASTLVFSKDYGVLDLLPQKAVVIKPVIDNTKVADTTKKQSPLPPPPPPTYIKDPFIDFGRFIRIKTVYPKAAFEAKQQSGIIIIGFHVDGSGMVSEINPLSSHGAAFADAVISSAKEYHGKIKDKAGDYKLGVSFVIPGVQDVNFPAPTVTKAAEYIGEIHIVGLTPAQRKKLMPPPPPPMATPGKPVTPGKVPPPPPAIEINKTPPPPPPAKALRKMPKPPLAPKVSVKVPAIEIEPVPAVDPKASSKPAKTTQYNAAAKQTAMNQMINGSLSVKRIMFPFDKNYQLKNGKNC